MFVLDKMSSPGWELKSDHIEHIFWLLDQCVCSSCKMTKIEYASYEDIEDEFLEENINPFTRDEFKPETYDQWSMLEKVHWLMSTPCGCEFSFCEDEHKLR